VEAAQLAQRRVAVLLPLRRRQLRRVRLHRRPALAQRHVHRLPHHALHVLARRVLRAQPVALLRVQRPREQRAEDGGLHLAPVGARGVGQHAQVGRRQLQRLGLAEEVAVEAQQLLGSEALALVHLLPQVFHRQPELGRVVPVGLDDLLERLSLQQLHVFGEHGEDAADEETRHALAVHPPPLQRRRELGQPLGHLARDHAAAHGRVQRLGTLPHGAQELDVVVALPQRAQVDAPRRVHAAVVAAPAVPHQQRAPHVHHHQVRRRPVRHVARVPLGLPVRHPQARSSPPRPRRVCFPSRMKCPWRYRSMKLVVSFPVRRSVVVTGYSNS
jgi:hypothetical protein